VPGNEAAGVPSIGALDQLPPDACVAALAPLFEGAPRFLARLCSARPFGSEAGLFAAARRIARSMPEADQVELIDAHPRLGAPPATVSPLSFVEQGYDGGAAQAAAEAETERYRVASELDRLNEAYEVRMGFRYCVFVAGRSRADLLPDFRAALTADRESERARALEAVVDIAADRWTQRSPASGATS
jgi:2-oxo-4-hydroxy-4-carboxy--5-ureidoimidazoline (OHCU) decarboxylase